MYSGRIYFISVVNRIFEQCLLILLTLLIEVEGHVDERDVGLDGNGMDAGARSLGPMLISPVPSI